MTCESLDLKAYALGEASPEERRAVKAHASACETCREELVRLESTRAALMCVREEEIPRRIAFISDKEVAPAWWQFWHMLPNMVLPAVAALALVAAFVIPRFATPATVVIRPAAPSVAAVAAAPGTEGEIDKRIQVAVAKAVAESEQRQAQQTAALLAAADRKHQVELRGVQVALEEDWRVKMKQLSTLYVAFNRMDDGAGR